MLKATVPFESSKTLSSYAGGDKIAGK